MELICINCGTKKGSPHRGCLAPLYRYVIKRFEK